MKHLLITGAAGLLGGYLLEAAKGRFEVTAAVRNRTAIDAAESVRVDLGDAEAVDRLFNDCKPEIIVHAAARSRVDECEQDPSAAWRDNVTAVENIVAAARRLRSRLIFISSDMVFDGRRGHYDESDAPSPLSFYGRTKWEAERRVAEWENGLILRSALILGRTSSGGRSFLDWAEERLRKGEPLPLFVDQFRTPVWAEDLADLVLEAAASGVCGLVHVGGPDRLSRYDFGIQLCRWGGYDAGLLQPVRAAEQRGRPQPLDLSLNSDKARALFRTPLLGVEEGLRRLFGRS